MFHSRLTIPTAAAVAAFAILAALLSASDKAPRPGSGAFEFYRLGGGKADLRSLRGEPVLLSIWATWCLSCREELPALARLNREWKEAGLRIVALSVDREGAQAVEPLLRELGIVDLPVFLDPAGRAVKEFSVSGLPTSILLDRKGRELGRWFGPRVWDAAATKQEALGLIAGGGSEGKAPSWK
jgi:thiol-disulfide isomerase/thioredoxin